MKRLSQTGYKTILFILAAALFAVILLSLALGRYPVPPLDAARILLSKVIPIEQTWQPRLETVLLNIRMPRILLACLVGCALSAAGTAYQGIFQNPMASPDVLGASSGAAFGAALALFLRLNSRMVTLFAFGMSMVSVALVWILGGKTRGKRIVGLVLSGMMISSLLSSCTSFIKLVADPNDQLPAITYWLMGSLSGASKADVKLAILPMALGLAPLLLSRWRMNLLSMGDDEARTMGVNAARLRLIVILCATLLTASSVAVSGMIGWVGLVVPHLSRRLVGNDCRRLLPTSMLFGALFLLITDNFSRTLFATEIPLGILTAFVGAPFFISLLVKGGDRV